MIWPTINIKDYDASVKAVSQNAEATGRCAWVTSLSVSYTILYE